MPRGPAKCQWVDLKSAVGTFASTTSGQQAADHIRPLHWYVSCRLVIEGGFHPNEITPRPPFVVRRKGRRVLLEHDPASAGGGERTVLGGLKTKVVDVVVAKNGIGPVVAVSVKGTLKAFRNLTNRMEEAVGDCTNLHIAYPALVYGFLQVLKAIREAPGVDPNDVAMRASGDVSDLISRYHDVLSRLAGRDDVRNDLTKYEAVALALASPERSSLGEIVPTFPPPDSPLLIQGFFGKLYTQYDQRFIFAAPGLEPTTRRLEWDSDSPVLGDARISGYEPRVAGT